MVGFTSALYFELAGGLGFFVFFPPLLLLRDLYFQFLFLWLWP